MFHQHDGQALPKAREPGPMSVPLAGPLAFFFYGWFVTYTSIDGGVAYSTRIPPTTSGIGPR